MIVATFLLAVSFAEPQEPAMRTLNLYDVRDFFEAESGSDPLLAVERDEFAAVVKHLLVTDRLAMVEMRGGSLVVRTTNVEQERVKQLLDGIRMDSLESCGVIAVVGSVPAGTCGDPTTLRIFPLDKGMPFWVRHSGQTGTIAVLAGASAPSLEITLERVTFLQGLPVKPLRRFELRDAKMVRYVEGYDVVDGVEGHPRGLAVPKVAEVEEGLVLDGYYVRVPTDDGNLNVRFHLELRTGAIERPIPVTKTEHGEVHAPVVRTRTLETEVTFPLEAGFAVVLEPAAGGTEETFVAVWVNATPR